MRSVRTGREQTMGRRRLFPGLVAALAMVACLVGSAAAQPPMAASGLAREAPALADLLALVPGMTIAEIGAGHGGMTVEMAKRTGPRGRVYSTELNPARLADIRLAVRRAGLRNVVVIKGDSDATNLPEACCDAIYMREVYHHLTDPAAMDASMYRALKPNGLIAVIDFAPRDGAPLPGVPKDRGGHGVSMKAVLHEMRQAGFELAREIPDWNDGLYAMLFQKAVRH